MIHTPRIWGFYSMKKIITILVIALSSCGMDNSNQPTKNIIIDEDFNGDVTLSEIFSDFDIIKIETNEESLLSNIWKIEKDTDRIFCFDESLGRVFIFNSEGSFIGKTAQKGKGPGEVLSCVDFSIDRRQNILEILDNMSKRILSYNYDGDLIDSKQGIPRSGFEIMNANDYIGYSYNQFVGIEPKIISFDNSGDQLKNFDIISKRDLQRNTFSNLEKSSLGEIFLIPVYEFNLFQFVDPLNFKQIAEFTFSHQIPNQKYTDGVDLQIKDAIKNDGAPYLINQLHIVNQTVYFQYLFGKESGHFFWNMNNNHPIFFKNNKLINDFIPNLPISIRGISEDGLLSVISARSLLKMLEDKKQYVDLSRILEEKSFDITNISPQDNPFIIKYLYNEEY